MEKEDTKSSIDLEWENRTLCRDENCIGVIGEDGRCKECGLAYDGSLPTQAHATPADDFPLEPQDAETETPMPDPTAATAMAPKINEEKDEDNNWENRTLCVDESCIGVIGSDGRCKECGKPYEKE